MIERNGERGSGISALAARLDDDMYKMNLELNNLQWLMFNLIGNDT